MRAEKNMQIFTANKKQVGTAVTRLICIWDVPGWNPRRRQAFITNVCRGFTLSLRENYSLMP
jgi:hypothetical protein